MPCPNGGRSGVSPPFELPGFMLHEYGSGKRKTFHWTDCKMLDQFSPHELQQLVDVANVGQWSWNLDSDEIRWSSQLGDIFGLEPDDYPDNIAELSALVPPSYGEDLRARFLESVDQESGCFEFDHPFIRGDGSDGWVRNRGRVEFCDQNQPRKLAAIVFDITTQKEIELSLQTRDCLLYTSPSPRDLSTSRMPSSA